MPSRNSSGVVKRSSLAEAATVECSTPSAVNAIPNVVAAPPGIVTYNDIPLALPKGLVSGLPGDTRER